MGKRATTTSLPANPAFIPQLAQSHEPPATDSSLSFPIYHHYQSTTSQTPPAPPPKPVPYPSPPATPIFVAPPPATLHRSSSEPLFQAHDNQYHPPEPTFKAPKPYSYTPRFDLPVETEKPPKNTEQDEMFKKVKSLE
ncbi:leucine-rich repeat extensin-like protein 4 [Nicotiana sylvestris]|uniref:leucine-rich repeat extensin-like protein 4 n=1 Tax=Nicotiana sylvestris TaxID=4096 RepID=UPI00388CC766